MKKIVSLNDGWEFAWSMYAGVNRELPGTAMFDDSIEWRPATVPGCVQNDLFTLGELDDPFYADNLDHYRWIEEVDVWYRLKTPPFQAKENQRVILVFEGLDCFATIWLNGRRIGKHDNMFIPLRLDVTDHINSAGGDELLVRLASTTDEPVVSHRDPNNFPPLRRTRTRKAQMSYGWDIAPRMVTVGLWRPVSLEIIDKGVILNTGARTVSVCPDYAKMEFVATVEWFSAPETVRVQFAFDGGTVECEYLMRGGVNDIVAPFVMDSPELWWPNGSGNQKLYDFTVTLGDGLDSKSARFGICEITTEETPREDGGIGFRLKVNGNDIFIKGVNWTPSDALFSRIDDERIRKLVDMAADANVNLLRVWGGGIYEKESFLEYCDERGIMIWQDFMFACSLYPQDNEFVAAIKTEVASVVRQYRGHVSMAVWAGDNENDYLFSPEAGSLNSRKHIPSVLKKLDPDRVYLPSSPFSKLGEDPSDKRFGDAHLWMHTRRHDDPFYTDPMPNLVSEIGRMSFPSRKTIDSFMPKEKQWPVTSPLWNFHGSDTVRWGVFRNIRHILKCLESYGINPPENLDEMIEVTQKIQADACRYWIETYASHPKGAGIVLWNLCDCWPQVSDALISYDLEPKAAYFAVAEAFAEIK